MSHFVTRLSKTPKFRSLRPISDLPRLFGHSKSFVRISATSQFGRCAASHERTEDGARFLSCMHRSMFPATDECTRRVVSRVGYKESDFLCFATGKRRIWRDLQEVGCNMSLWDCQTSKRGYPGMKTQLNFRKSSNLAPQHIQVCWRDPVQSWWSKYPNFKRYLYATTLSWNE